jgi:hypothetical protein
MIMATATPTPMPADAPSLNPPLLGLPLGLFELLLGEDILVGNDVSVGNERAAEEAEDVVAAEELVLELVEDDVVEATTTAWPKSHPLI